MSLKEKVWGHLYVLEGIKMDSFYTVCDEGDARCK